MEEINEIDILLDTSIAVMARVGGTLVLPQMAGRGEDIAATVVALPLPPSTNSLFPGRARRHRSAEYERWLAEAPLWLREQPQLWRYGSLVKPPPKARWLLHQFIFLPNWRSDMDNRYKASIDFLCASFGLSDRYLVQHSALRCTGPLTGVVNLLGWGE